MKVYFPFPDNKIKYNCIECNATCCHVNNLLQITPEQKDIVLEENPLLENFIRESDGVNYLYSGKKCWFLDEGGCNIHKNHGKEKKPLSCQIYPLRFRMINSQLIVGEYIPCPDFKIVSNDGINHQTYEKLFRKNNMQDRLINMSINTLDERLLLEKEFLEEFDTNFSNYLSKYVNTPAWLKLSNQQKGVAQKIFWLYPQIRMQEPILKLPFQWSLNSMETFFNIICEVVVYSSNNIQNVYTLVLDKFLKSINNKMHLIF